MKIIWFDIGSHMGWAHNADDEGIEYGSQKFEGIRAHRQAALMAWLRRILPHIGAEAVGFERPFARGRDATRSLWGMAGVIEAVATEMGLPVVDEEPQSIKKFWTGSGKADKDAMQAEAIMRGFTPANEHEADAIAGLHYGIQHIAKAETCPSPRAAVISTSQTRKSGRASRSTTSRGSDKPASITSPT